MTGAAHTASVGKLKTVEVTGNGSGTNGAQSNIWVDTNLVQTEYYQL